MADSVLMPFVSLLVNKRLDECEAILSKYIRDVAKQSYRQLSESMEETNIDDLGLDDETIKEFDDSLKTDSNIEASPANGEEESEDFATQEELDAALNRLVADIQAMVAKDEPINAPDDDSHIDGDIDLKEFAEDEEITTDTDANKGYITLDDLNHGFSTVEDEIAQILKDIGVTDDSDENVDLTGNVDDKHEEEVSLDKQPNGTETLNPDDDDDFDRLIQEFAALDESVASEMKKINLTADADGTEVGNGKKINTNNRSPISGSEKVTASPIKIKSDEHNGFNKEDSPTVASPKNAEQWNVNVKGSEVKPPKKEGEVGAGKTMTNESVKKPNLRNKVK